MPREPGTGHSTHTPPTLRRELANAFRAVAVVPLILLALGLAAWGVVSQIGRAENLQSEIADQISVEIGKSLVGFLDTLETISATRASAFGADDAAETLHLVLIPQFDFVESFYVDAEGIETFRVSSRRVVSGTQQPSTSDVVRAVLDGGEPLIGDSRFASEIGAWVVTAAVPVVDPYSRRLAGVLGGEAPLQTVATILRKGGRDHSVEVFVVDSDGRVVAHPRESEALAGRAIGESDWSGLRSGLQGGWVFRRIAPIEPTGGSLLVVIEEGILAAVAPAASGLVAAVILVFVAVVAIRVRRRLTRRIGEPIEDLSVQAEELAKGNLTARARPSSIAEFSSLAESFNFMANRLQTTIQGLRHSNRELEEFASVAAHDLQEPLRKIQVYGSRLAWIHRFFGLVS